MIRIACFVLAFAACATARSSEDLLESARTYNDGIRWQRFPAAAGRVPPAERDAFLQERDRLAEELHISDYEIIRVTGKRDGRATIQVKYTWFLDSEGKVNETHAIQTWERRAKYWVVTSEARLRGEAMPGLAEPAMAPEGGADAGPGAAAGTSEATGG